MSDEINHWICFLYLKRCSSQRSSHSIRCVRSQRADPVSSSWTGFRSCSEVQIQPKYSSHAEVHFIHLNGTIELVLIRQRWGKKALFICSLRRFLFLFTWQRSWDGLTGSLDADRCYRVRCVKEMFRYFFSCVCGKTTKKHDVFVFVFVTTKPDVSN